ncbi:MAG TPA: ABC transporter ATP-binding protein [Acidimicrobiia bacterium]
MDAAIRTKNLTKYYGRSRGVVGVDLEVPRGMVVGFLGPNGAGKTTTMRLLMDLIRPSTGRAEVLGLDVRTHTIEIRRRVGYLPGDFSMYQRLTPREMFLFFAHLRRRSGLGWAEELSDRLQLDLDRPIHHLSSGNRQKVGVVQAFMHRPEVLILDEPTAGLDPLMQREFFAIVREAIAEGSTVFLSSHILDEVERIAERVAIIREGHLVATEDVGKLKGSAVSSLSIMFADPVSSEDFEGIPGVEGVSVEDRLLTCKVIGSVDQLLRTVTKFEVVGIKSSEADLEEVFMRYFGEVSRAP